ncbi:MAG: IS630 family transposase [Flavobacteriales bacterium]|nr:IS630 family transposase [Flavobacteriales bacterium]
MARKAAPIPINDEQRAELRMMARSHSIEKRYAQRAQVVLLSAEGLSMEVVAKRSGFSWSVVNKWRNRFRQKGIDGLRDAARPGKPTSIPATTKARIVQLACERPAGGYTSWSQERIAKATGVSKSTVQGVLQRADLKPHRTEYWCGKSPDPEFESKMLAIVGLYMNPPANAIVLSVDEKTQIQALDRTQLVLALRTGTPKRMTATYKRNGTVALMAALAVHTGEVTATPVKANNTATFLAFLKKLDRTFRNKHLHIIVDNLATHRSQEVKEWLRRKRKITLHYTPTYSSWLNQVETFFNILSKDVIKGGVWTSKQQLVDQLMDYIRTYNRERAKPFEWTYTGKPLSV